jgi:prepilin-type N-terminal cleavage/methylation domain-containing protein
LSNPVFGISHQKRRRAKAGFTLVELVVVVLIIGLLSALALPQYHKVVERAKLSEVQAYFGVLKSAEERYILKNGRYCYDMYAVECSFDIAIPPLKYYSADYTITQRTAGGRKEKLFGDQIYSALLESFKALVGKQMILMCS